MNRGRFITLEGMDGAGKTTQLGWLEQWLRRRGIDLVVTREPGGTALGESLRQLLLHANEARAPETEALLMFAARNEHLAQVIRPALAAGRWVLCDRFTDATFAYQAGGSGMEWTKIAALEEWVQHGLQPDMTLYLDLDPAIGRQRSGAVRTPDRFEREEAVFYARVRDAYLRRAREAPERIRIVDAAESIQNVQNQLEEVLLKYCL
jgi:dTMP kinase